jgi:hypothetical protein
MPVTQARALAQPGEGMREVIRVHRRPGLTGEDQPVILPQRPAAICASACRTRCCQNLVFFPADARLRPVAGACRVLVPLGDPQRGDAYPRQRQRVGAAVGLKNLLVGERVAADAVRACAVQPFPAWRLVQEKRYQ